MSNVRIDFTHCIQDAQELGSNDEYLVSRVYFTASAGDKRSEEAHCDIKQAVGSRFESGSIEVGQIVGLNIEVNYDDFRAAVESYFRKLVGAAGVGIRIEGASNVRMRNNEFHIAMNFEVRPGDEKGGW